MTKRTARRARAHARTVCGEVGLVLDDGRRLACSLPADHGGDQHAAEFSDADVAASKVLGEWLDAVEARTGDRPEAMTWPTSLLSDEARRGGLRLPAPVGADAIAARAVDELTAAAAAAVEIGPDGTVKRRTVRLDAGDVEAAGELAEVAETGDTTGP